MSGTEPGIERDAMLGLRLGEVAGLPRSRVDLDGGLVTIAESIGETSGRTFTKGPKSSAGRRTLPLPLGLVIVLREHVGANPANGADPYLFTAPQGGMLRLSHWRGGSGLPPAGAQGSGSTTSDGPTPPCSSPPA